MFNTDVASSVHHTGVKEKTGWKKTKMRINEHIKIFRRSKRLWQRWSEYQLSGFDTMQLWQLHPSSHVDYRWQWCSGKFGIVETLESPLPLLSLSFLLPFPSVPSFPLSSPPLPYLVAIISMILQRINLP